MKSVLLVAGVVILLLMGGKLGGGALILLVCGGGLLYAFAGRGGATAGRSLQVRGHVHGGGGRKTVAIHEAGHAAAARGLGGRVRSARLYAGASGGLVQATLPDHKPETAVAFLLAGQYAAGTSQGAGADNSDIRRELRTVPSRDRAKVRRAAESQARRIVSQRAGQIARDAERLDTRGRL